MTKKSVFETLSNIEINKDNIEKKGQFNYISWAAAWQDVSQKYPDATFVKRLSEVNGFVEVDVTIEGKTLTEQFPILNYNNKPVQNPNAFDINTAFQRGLVKCLAYFGYGLFIYKGEDLPPENQTTNEEDDDISEDELFKIQEYEGLVLELQNMSKEQFILQKDKIKERKDRLTTKHQSLVKDLCIEKGFLTT